MANILIVGFTAEEARQIQAEIDAVMKQLGKDSEGQSATVILNAETKWCGGTGRAPYLVVRHSKASEADVIADAIHDAIPTVDIEVEVLHRYLPRVRQDFAV